MPTFSAAVALPRSAWSLRLCYKSRSLRNGVQARTKGRVVTAGGQGDQRGSPNAELLPPLSRAESDAYPTAAFEPKLLLSGVAFNVTDSDRNIARKA